MIGDWVIHKNEPIMVWEIDDYYDRINTEPDGYNAITCIEISEVTPIPLTAEILEKNFNSIENLPYSDRYYYYTNYTEVEITEYIDSIWKVAVDVEMRGLPTWEMYVTYVHELQHALRLCNINKEIEI